MRQRNEEKEKETDGKRNSRELLCFIFSVVQVLGKD